MSSRELKGDEKDLVEIVVARDGLAVIVHPSNPVLGAKVAEVKQIFAGDLRNWKLLGGPDRAITVVTREEGSGTRGAFQELVMGKTRIFRGAITEDSNGTVREIVAHDPYSVGFISLGLVNDQVRALELDGAVGERRDTSGTGSYKLVRPFLFVSLGEPAGHAKEFIDFVLSAGRAGPGQEGRAPSDQVTGRAGMDASTKKRGKNRLERNDRLVRLALLVVAFSAVSDPPRHHRIHHRAGDPDHVQVRPEELPGRVELVSFGKALRAPADDRRLALGHRWGPWSSASPSAWRAPSS